MFTLSNSLSLQHSVCVRIHTWLHVAYLNVAYARGWHWSLPQLFCILYIVAGSLNTPRGCWSSVSGCWVYRQGATAITTWLYVGAGIWTVLMLLWQVHHHRAIYLASGTTVLQRESFGCVLKAGAWHLNNTIWGWVCGWLGRVLALLVWSPRLNRHNHINQILGYMSLIQACMR